jgi:glyoxylase-like metal-dependent hydrolase (beta-lactamase superfamily II)
MTTVNRIDVPIPFPLKQANCYYIEDSIPTLIDAGVKTDEAFETISGAIEGKGGSIDKVRRIILTHCHSDHLGLATRIAGISGARIFMHILDREFVAHNLGEEPQAQRNRFHKFFLEAGVPSDLMEPAIDSMSNRFKRFFTPFEDEEILEGGEVFAFDDFNLEVIHTPGHSRGSICLLNRDDGTLFSGDSLLEDITSNPVVQIRHPDEKSDYRSLATYEASLEIIKALPARTVLPGHGPPFSNHQERVNQMQEHHRLRRTEVMNILIADNTRPRRERRTTQYMLAMALFPDLKGIEFFLGLSEALAHLETLEDEGVVKSELESGRRFYYIV